MHLKNRAWCFADGISSSIKSNLPKPNYSGSLLERNCLPVSPHFSFPLAGNKMAELCGKWRPPGPKGKERKKERDRERDSPQQLRWQIERNRVRGTSRVESASGEARSGHPPWFNATRLATILSGRKLVLLGETQPDCGSRESGNVRSGTINYSVVNFRAPPSVRRIAWAKGSFHFEP